MHLLGGGRSGLNNFLLLFEVDLTFRVFNKTPRAFILSVEKKKKLEISYRGRKQSAKEHRRRSLRCREARFLEICTSDYNYAYVRQSIFNESQCLVKKNSKEI